MASVEALEKRVEKLEQSNTLPPVIVWPGQEEKVTLMPGQKVIVVRYIDEKKNDRE